MKNILIVGADGMLGGELFQKMSNNKNYNVFGTTINDLDITNSQSVIDFANKVSPDIIVNCAAYTNVDGCETNIELANNVNELAVGNLAKAANNSDAILMHISTDYVFDGDLDVLQSYTEDMLVNPVSAYGKSKLGGEEFAKKANKFYILRTAWLYGNGNNFVRTMLKLSETRDEISVVCDQNGSPTSATTLCEIIENVIEKALPFGIYHATNEGFTTWYDFAVLIFELTNKKTIVNPVTSQQYVTPTKRPKNSKLSKDKLKSYGIFPEDYKTALKNYLIKEGKI